MERGYVKLWRKALDSGLLPNGPAWQLFGYLLMRANYKGSTATVSGVVVNVSPGQVIFGRNEAANFLKLSEQNVRTALKLLEKMKIVTIQPTNKFTLISFINWVTYQHHQPEDNQQTNQQVTSDSPAPNQRLTTSKEGKKERREEGDINIIAPSGKPLPAVRLVFSKADALRIFESGETPTPDSSRYYLPVKSKGNTEVCFFKAEQWETWVSIYGFAMVESELKKAYSWCLTNPDKQKTPAGLHRFFNSWLEKAQNSGRGGTRASPALTERQRQADQSLEATKFLEEIRNGNGQSHTSPTFCAEPNLPAQYTELGLGDDWGGMDKGF